MSKQTVRPVPYHISFDEAAADRRHSHVQAPGLAQYCKLLIFTWFFFRVYYHSLPLCSLLLGKGEGQAGSLQRSGGHLDNYYYMAMGKKLLNRVTAGPLFTESCIVTLW